MRSRCVANWVISTRSRGPETACAALALCLLLGAGCASTSVHPSPSQPAPARNLLPWQVPQEAYGSQRLYRVSYSGPEGEGSFKVTLRLVSPARYQVQASDPLGRSLWSLDVNHDDGLWLNHHSRNYCQFAGRFDVSGVPLGPFPLLSLPSLLMGRVPGEPATGSPTAEARGREFDFKDAEDRRWTGALGEGGSVLSWTLSEGSTPKVWWMRREDWAILSDRERGVQVRWREVLRENLDREPPRLVPPSDYKKTPCGEPDLPTSEG
jgi:hypothetical protein